MRRVPTEAALERLAAAVRRIAAETSGRGDQAARLARAFVSVDAILTDAENQPVACSPGAFYLPKVYFRAPTATGDCCAASLPWGEFDIEGIIRRADTSHGRAGLTVRYVSAADLTTMRRAVGRPKDIRRADELERLVAHPR
jgi:hypothetical protein